MREKIPVYEQYKFTDAQKWALWNQILNHVRKIAGLPLRPEEENPYDKRLHLREGFFEEEEKS